jgi:hypothetical protein
MLLTIIKYLDEYEIRGKGYLADSAGYYDTIKMNIVDVLRAIVHTNNGQMYPMKTTHSTRCIIMFQRYNMGTTSHF